ncbi:MAG: hypothetical protein SGILL_006148, partial [Bacillariaceae sp.]
MFVELPSKRNKKPPAVAFPDGGSIGHNIKVEKAVSSLRTDDPAISLDSSASSTLEDSISFNGFSSHHRQISSSHHSTGSSIAKRVASNVPSIPEDEPSLNASFAEDLAEPLTLREVQEIIKSVRWSIVEIQEYAIIAGDSPACTKGAPLTIDWEPGPTMICTVDQYEGEKRYYRCQLEMLL